MDAEADAQLRDLLSTQKVASLGTLRRGREFDEPSVSMVPFAWLPGGCDIVLQVSALAPHTRHMADHPKVSLMICAPLADGANPQALPRATLQGDIGRIPPESAGYEIGKAAYLERFPLAGQTFALGDFSLVRLTPRSLHFVAGFGRTYSVKPEALARLLAGEATAAPDAG